MNTTDQDEANMQKAWMEKLLYFLKGDRDALAFLVDLMYVVHLWDDLIDKDKDRSDFEINEAFRILMVDIPGNPFYIRFGSHLRPLLQNMILQWLDANVLEKASDHDKHMAYMLRSSPLQVMNYCAFLIGGPVWYEDVGPNMRRIYEESLDDFMGEMRNA